MITKDKKLKGIICLLVVLVIFCFSVTGCTTPDDQMPQIQGFSVHYIDVGNGDCIFINFDDGKTMVIDSGAPTDNNYKNITKFLKTYNVSVIDYLVLTHPDIDHIGNACKIIADYTIGKAYIPKIVQKNDYPTFAQVYQSLSQEGCQVLGSI